jgi:hypothetical protein
LFVDRGLECLDMIHETLKQVADAIVAGMAVMILAVIIPAAIGWCIGVPLAIVVWLVRMAL